MNDKQEELKTTLLNPVASSSKIKRHVPPLLSLPECLAYTCPEQSNSDLSSSTAAGTTDQDKQSFLITRLPKAMIHQWKQISSFRQHSVKSRLSSNDIKDQKRLYSYYHDPNISPCSTAVADEEKGYFHIHAAQKIKKTPRGRIAALVMILFGFLIVIVFIIMGLGKATESNEDSIDSMQNSTVSASFVDANKLMMMPTTHLPSQTNSQTELMPTPIHDTVTRFILIEDASVLNQIITQAGVTPSYLPIPS
ncbi:hypothetical protein BCV72DRAFT_335405 [Rhizopus microsporus var. microsporus]|uniref:Uncharacterized protein n=2 Tax=Rhizopus microsporus TaxID=58291 RepID=A0A2G4SUI5_RHIZD|nr:uncharacterized protein RHIMIDRAFT_281960 [Rhizopus microsporus ATCC 52813]ORE07074.1 hypothetical protein BCV72DRAFT_335405 [Rhizopus microsporus var. microsporus]PHZ12414.1 hypothetical protein RHIMIDRAFT_281960 [Rhizopus microsporus ATCC 52813]